MTRTLRQLERSCDVAMHTLPVHVHFFMLTRRLTGRAENEEQAPRVFQHCFQDAQPPRVAGSSLEGGGRGLHQGHQ